LDSKLRRIHDEPGSQSTDACEGPVFNVRSSIWKYGLSSMAAQPLVRLQGF
jgi:hypothetical protein